MLLVERRAALSNLSRALVISTRSMEILRGWRLTDAVRAGAADVEPCGWVTPTLTSGEAPRSRSATRRPRRPRRPARPDRPGRRRTTWSRCWPSSSPGTRARSSGRDRLVDATEAEIGALIAAATGAPDLAPRIEQVNAFAFAAQLAERYRVGRCFLAGDAAHRMTPRGGTGMNTGLQDAHDLGWKLGWVLRGRAAPALLHSYEAERRPVGQHNVER